MVSQEIFSVATRGSTQLIEEWTALECRLSRRARECRARWKGEDFLRKGTAAVPETDQLFAETVARHGLKCSGVIKEEYFAKLIY